MPADELEGSPEGAADITPMAGFPPEPDSLVTLANWQDPPFSRWAFRHLREIIPTHLIAAGTGRPTRLPSKDKRVTDVRLVRMDHSSATLGDVLDDTWTDAVVIVHGERIAHEWYAPGMQTDTPHLLMSVSKSIVGCVAGILVGQGRLHPDDKVESYVPEAKSSGYAGATVRHLLDMRTGVAFREDYTASDAEVRVMERSMGWRPPVEGDPVGMYEYLTTLASDGPHGGPFVYRSADTDMLGWVCERAADARMADLVSTLLWQPMGAEHDAHITCDAVGSAVHDGGISATARDLARFGLLLLRNGRIGGRQVMPSSWLADGRRPPDDVSAAFEGSGHDAFLPAGWYRNQLWYVPGRHDDVVLALGIYGQMVHVDPATRTVSVKLSSWPDAQDPAHLVDTIRAFGAVGAHLAGLPPVANGG